MNSLCEKIRSGQLKYSLIGWLFILLYGCAGSPTRPPLDDDSSAVKSAMLTATRTLLMADNKLPEAVRSGLAQRVLEPLKQTSHIEVSGQDAQTRPLAVNFQKAFEQSLLSLLDNRQIRAVTAIIHTPLPATPLCNPTGQALESSLNPEMRRDPARIKTVADRTLTLRQLARYGRGVTLYIAYPKAGLGKRTTEQQLIYHNERKNKANRSLKDAPPSCLQMPENLVGATYIITTPKQQELLFSLVGKQAVEGQGMTRWQLWFDKVSQEPVRNRYQEVTEYLKSCGLDIPRQSKTDR